MTSSSLKMQSEHSQFWVCLNQNRIPNELGNTIEISMKSTTSASDNLTLKMHIFLRDRKRQKKEKKLAAAYCSNRKCIKRLGIQKQKIMTVTLFSAYRSLIRAARWFDLLWFVLMQWKSVPIAPFYAIVIMIVWFCIDGWWSNNHTNETMSSVIRVVLVFFCSLSH